MREITIAGRKLGDGHPPFIVAEAGINHNGSLDRALAMVTVAKQAGCDAIKFSAFKAAEFCNPRHSITYHHQGVLVTEPEIEMFRRCELPDGSWRTIKYECDRHGIIFFATPQNESDLLPLLDVGVPCIKVGSDDLTNLALIESYAKHGLPMILSTGMAESHDVFCAMRAALPRQMMLLVCTSEYPCPLENANLQRITTLQSAVTIPVGFSDHTIGAKAAIIATALGACYLEKHFTLSNEMRGPDHAFSANPAGLERWASAIRKTRVLMGSGAIEPTQQERVNRINWRRTSGQKIRGAV